MKISSRIFGLCMLATTMCAHGMWIIWDEVDANDIKRGGFKYATGEMYTEYRYLYAYKLFGLTWFTRGYSLKEMLAGVHRGKQFIYPEPLEICLKTKALIATTITLPLLTYKSYYLWKTAKNVAPSIKNSICNYLCERS